jgi:SAM-dependent methyltransferase
MEDRTLQQQIDAASSYQDQLVPGLMEAWAPRVAEAGRIGPGDRVLDVACGTGVLARAAAKRASPGGVVTGLDLNPGMLAVAERLSPTLQWKQGRADALPFADESFDVVASQFGLMFFPDPAKALREMMRVLIPGGRLAVAVWASLTDTPAYAAEVELLDRVAGTAAGDAMRAPFILGDAERLTGIFDEAGIAGATVDLQGGRGRFPSIRSMVEVDVRGWLPLTGIVLDEALIEEILTEAEIAIRPFVTDEAGHVVFHSPALLATATKPGGLRAGEA